MKKCAEIKELQQKYDTHNVHKKVKEFFGLCGKLRNENNGIIAKTKDKLGYRKKNVETLSHDDRPPNPPVTEYSKRK